MDGRGLLCFVRMEPKRQRTIYNICRSRREIRDPMNARHISNIERGGERTREGQGAMEEKKDIQRKRRESRASLYLYYLLTPVCCLLFLSMSGVESIARLMGHDCMRGVTHIPFAPPPSSSQSIPMACMIVSIPAPPFQHSTP